jgi:hypothetical protein
MLQMSDVHEAFLRAAEQPGIGERQRDSELRRSRELMELYNTQLDRMQIAERERSPR